MKNLYFECKMGAAGDMINAALLDLLDDPEQILDQLNSLGIGDLQVRLERTARQGIYGNHFRVIYKGEEEQSLDFDDHSHDHSHEHGHTHLHCHDHDHEDYEGHDHHHEHNHEHEHCHDHDHDHHHDHEHGHRHSHAHVGLREIRDKLNSLDLSDKVREDALDIYDLIGRSEAAAHECDIEQVHFHEVGSVDALVDVLAACLLIEKIKPDRILASPLNLGGGLVRCAHGILPVPAPATAHILKGVPSYSGSIKSELTTPTGAAILKHFVDDFVDQPLMKIEKIGYGMGSKDFEICNCIRAYLSYEDDENMKDKVVELACQMDDIKGEDLAFAMDRLLEEGALDLYWQNIGMKKSRPGLLLTVICKLEDEGKMRDLIFKHTSTLGIRRLEQDRYKLDRKELSKELDGQRVRIKDSRGYGCKKDKWEYEDLARLAKKGDKSLEQIREELRNIK